MTDTTDIAALREAAMKATPGPWSVARDGSVISNQYHPLATVSDGFHRLRSDGETGQDAEFIALANPATILSLLDQLEAERQRADALQSTVGRLAQESNRLFDDRQRINKNWTEAETDNALLRDEITVLKAKLANPVVLKPAYKQSDYNLMGLEPSDAYGLAWGSSATRDDSVKQIREAGFTVKGE